MRGYLWEHLAEDIAAEFAQVHPLAQLQSEIPFKERSGWHIEGRLGDMSGIRKSTKGRRRGAKSTSSVKELRARRKAAGLCIDCEAERHPKSRNYCPTHRERDRLRAEKRRAAQKAA